MVVRNNQVQQPTFYVNRTGDICEDNSSGPLKGVKHKALAVVKKNNYNIEDVFTTLVEKKDTKVKPEQARVIVKQVGAKYKVDEQVLSQFKQAVDLPSGSPVSQRSISQIADVVAADPKTKANFQAIGSRMHKGTQAESVVKKIMTLGALKAKLKELDLDPALADKFTEDLSFLFQTRIIYSIIGYQNTTAAGKKEHELKTANDANGNPVLLMKKQGRWVTVKAVREQFGWDNNEKMLVSKDNKNERWNYFHNGLVPVDRFYHHESKDDANYPKQNSQLQPVAQLSTEEMSKLLEHAKTFTNFTNKSDDKQKNFNCVVQFVTHPRPMKRGKIYDNLNAQVPVHCGIRLIMPNGKVYSTGFGSTLHEDQWNDGLSKYAATINGQPTIMDYEEFRQHKGRIVTSVPLTEKDAQGILKSLNEARKNSIRFNIVSQNCMKLGVHVLKKAGVDLDIRVPFGTFVKRLLPDAENIPLVGKPYAKVTLLGRKIVQVVDARTPNLVKKIFTSIYSVAIYLPSKAGTLMVNFLVYTLGGHTASPVANPGREQEDLKDVKKLIRHPFDADASTVEHSSVFVNWQLQQGSTVVHNYKGQPAMNILPSSSEEDKKYSESRVEELKRVYKHSTPVFTAPKKPVAALTA